MRRVSSLIFLLVLISAGVASATTVAKLTLEQLIEASDRIVVGEVESTEAFVRDGRVLTRIVVDVEDVWKGESTDEVEIIHLGGRTEKLATRVHGMPHFSVGERALLFLEQPKGHEHFVVTGLSQGKYAIDGDGEDAKIRPQLDAGSLVVRNPQGGQLRLADDGEAPTQSRLVEFKRRIVDIVQAETAAE